MAKTQTTPMNLSLDLMVALKPLEGRVYQHSESNQAMRIDKIGNRSARVTAIAYNPKIGDTVVEARISFADFRMYQSYRNATIAQVKLFEDAIRKHESARMQSRYPIRR